MRHTPLQKQLVFDYYERIAGVYHQKASQKSGYHQYFFNQRIKDALIEITDLTGKSILDVGAGTGSFYDCISVQTTVCAYKAVDLSPQMLNKSKIPKHQQYAGDILQMDFPSNSFDIIVLLGVSTYMTKSDVTALFKLFEQWLTPTGKIIATFTNSQSIDNCFRNILRPISHFFSKNKNSIIQQKFQVNSYKPAILHKSIKHQFQVNKIIWQNQTITPFNQLFPKLSISLANFLNKHLPGNFLPLFSADFMVVFTKIDEKT